MLLSFRISRGTLGRKTGDKAGVIIFMSASTFGKIGESRCSEGDEHSCSRVAAIARDSITHLGSDVGERGKRSTGIV